MRDSMPMCAMDKEMIRAFRTADGRAFLFNSALLVPD